MTWSFCVFFLFFFPLWVHGSSLVSFPRKPSLSPDGKWLIYSWNGDLWKVSSQGGESTQLTTHPAYDTSPVWSPDGKKIAFASNRYGSYDVFVMHADGSHLSRLTFHSKTDQPVTWSPDGKKIYFLSVRDLDVHKNSYLYEIPVEGGMPFRTLKATMVDAKISPSGRYLAMVRGTHSAWKRHYKMPYLRNLWLYDFQTQQFKELTPKNFTSDFPNWINENELVYRSEEKDSWNVWKVNAKTLKRTPLTFLKSKQDMRFLSSNTTHFVWEGWKDLFLQALDSKKNTKLSIRAMKSSQQNAWIYTQHYTKGISRFATSSKGEIAFVSNGNLWVKKFKSANKKAFPISVDSWRVRNFSWSPDGSQLVFDWDKEGTPQLLIAKSAASQVGGKLKKHLFTDSFSPSIVTFSPKKTKLSERNPKWSPNGKWIAFVQGKGNLVIRSTDGKGTTRLLSRSWNLLDIQWSPNSQWIAITRMNRDSNEDVWLVPVYGKRKVYNVSRHPKDDFSPTWSSNGRVFAYLGQDFFHNYHIHFAFLKPIDREKNDTELQQTFAQWKRMATSQKKKKQFERLHKSLYPQEIQPKSKKRRPIPFLRLSGLATHIRSIALPHGVSPRDLIVSPDGSEFTVASTGKEKGVFQIQWNGKGWKKISSLPSTQLESKNGLQLLFLSKSKKLYRTGKKTMEFVFDANARFHRKSAMVQMFHEAAGWIQMLFYDPKHHGVDWPKVKEKYSEWLKEIEKQQDFLSLIQWMVGELNASHMGIFHRSKGLEPSSADLGLTFSKNHQGKGLLVESVRYKGPSSRMLKRIHSGDVLTHLDGEILSKQKNIQSLLQGKSEQKVQLTLQRKGKTHQVVVFPVTWRKAFEQRYIAWVRNNRRQVAKHSQRKLGYIHIQSMNLKSVSQFQKDLFAYSYGKKALIVDVRSNGGGWTTDFLLTMFRPKPHALTKWQGGGFGYPTERRVFYHWSRPVVLLTNERSFSNAEIFSHAFKNLKIGKIVGMPTGGGVISTRWVRLLNNTFFGVPLRGWWTLPQKINMENNPAQPDIRVPLLPSDEHLGTDPQLLKAIQQLMP